jgi:hypothetical protein
MEDFASINAVYSSYFGGSPPARACVAVDLPAPLRLMLDSVAYAEEKASDRQALHVQGLSYWAPANIGPYSQAVVVRLLFFASFNPKSLTPSGPGKRTRVRFRPDRPNSEFLGHPVSPLACNRNTTGFATCRSRCRGAPVK